MANFSNWAESGILNMLFRANTNGFTAPLNISIALTGPVPLETQNGATMNELPNAGSYARVNLGAPANASWTEPSQVANSGNISNVSDITFPTATANWGWVSGVAIMNSGVYGLGEIICYGALATPREVLNGDTFKFSSTNLNLYLG